MKHHKVQAKIAVLNKQFKQAERILVEKVLSIIPVQYILYVTCV